MANKKVRALEILNNGVFVAGEGKDKHVETFKYKSQYFNLIETGRILRSQYITKSNSVDEYTDASKLIGKFGASRGVC